MKKLINKIRAKIHEAIADYYFACYETAINKGDDVEAGICAARYNEFMKKIANT